ncbi:hypothetical protein FDECE_6537 [Fusarium decemcellulare]|nr:hypothetical protein FDECE_6537 [Fusarium decemcellulare]
MSLPIGLPQRYTFDTFVAMHWREVDAGLATPMLQAALRELWDDWVSYQNEDYWFDPWTEDVDRIVLLVAVEPDRWCYNRLYPNKENWTELAHAARFVLKWEAFAESQNTGFRISLLPHIERFRIIEHGLCLARLYIKTRQTEESRRPTASVVDISDSESSD